MAAVLLEVPVEDGAVLVVEADRQDISEDLILASPVGEIAAKATHSLAFYCGLGDAGRPSPGGDQCAGCQHGT
jgi:hypothetical protein